MHNKYSIDNFQLLSLGILNCASDACKIHLYLIHIVYDLSPGELFPLFVCPPPYPHPPGFKCLPDQVLQARSTFSVYSAW